MNSKLLCFHHINMIQLNKDMDEEAIQKRIAELKRLIEEEEEYRKKRMQLRNASWKKRYQNDAEYRKECDRKARERERIKYQTDPEYRERKREKNRQQREKKKEAERNGGNSNVGRAPEATTDDAGESKQKSPPIHCAEVEN